VTTAAVATHVRSQGEFLGVLALRAAVIGYVALLIIIPLAALVTAATAGGFDDVWAAVNTSVARNALLLTVWTSFLAALANALFGTLTAFVLVRYRFPGRAFLDALVDLPFAIPTLVAGVMLVLLFGPDRLLGGWLNARGVEVLFTPGAIVLALLFVTLPFVVRAVQPVLLEVDPAEEEAARTMGASPLLTFRRIHLPTIAPAVLQGSLQAFARALAEFGSIVVVAGNIPHSTLTAPVLIFGEVESGRPQTAAAISVVLLAGALGVSYVARTLRERRKHS